MRIVLVMVVAALAACSPRPRVPPLTPVQQAQNTCAEIGHQRQSPEHSACTERLVGKMMDGDSAARAADIGRRPVWQPPQPQTIYVRPQNPNVFTPAR